MTLFLHENMSFSLIITYCEELKLNKNIEQGSISCARLNRTKIYKGIGQ